MHVPRVGLRVGHVRVLSTRAHSVLFAIEQIPIDISLVNVDIHFSFKPNPKPPFKHGTYVLSGGYVIDIIRARLFGSSR